jgi:hypothetical protein
MKEKMIDILFSIHKRYKKAVVERTITQTLFDEIQQYKNFIKDDCSLYCIEERTKKTRGVTGRSKYKGYFIFKIMPNTMNRRVTKGFYGKVPKFSYNPTEIRRAGIQYRMQQQNKEQFVKKLRAKAKSNHNNI